ncbi:hypothetical protein SGLAM104S_07153 [Streptomyces glaucescens]
MGGPGVGDRLGDVVPEGPSRCGRSICCPAGSRPARTRAAPVAQGRRVEQRERTVGHGFRRRVVAQVRGRGRRPRRPARTWSKRLSPEPPLTATVRTVASGSAQATRMPCAVAGRRSAARAASSRTVSGWSSSQTRPRPAAALRVGGVGHQGPYDAQVQRAREGVGDTGVGGVGVGVGDVQRDVVLDQGVHDPALEGGGRDRRRSAQVQRVVGDQQVGAELHGLVADDLLDGVDGEQDPGDLLAWGTPIDRSDRVPGLGPFGGPQVLQRGDDFRQTGHEQQQLPACSAGLNRCVTARPPHRGRYGPAHRPAPDRHLDSAHRPGTPTGIRRPATRARRPVEHIAVPVPLR